MVYRIICVNCLKCRRRTDAVEPYVAVCTSHLWSYWTHLIRNCFLRWTLLDRFHQSYIEPMSLWAYVIRYSIRCPTSPKPQGKMMKAACIHRMCSVCSIGLPQHLLKIQLHYRTECWKRNWRFILPCGFRLMGHHILNLPIFVIAVPRRKTFWI